MFRCDFCGSCFKRETSYDNHVCKEMQRSEELTTPLGVSAYQIFCKWYSLQRRSKPSLEAFANSIHYKAVFKFAEFAKKTKINIPVFLKLTTDLKLTPGTWLRDDVYARYIEYIDQSVPVADVIKMSVDYIMRLADVMSCDTSVVFNELLPTEMAQMIRDRKISPWILLHSIAFKRWLIAQTEEDQLILQDLIRPMYWRLRFQREPTMVKHAKAVAKALGL